MLRVAAFAALSACAAAVPVNTISFYSSLAVDESYDVSAVETVLSGVASSTLGFPVVASAGDHRRLQAGTTLSIQYVITCGNSCDSVSAALADVAAGGASATTFASAIIDAVNDAATSSGFAGAAVLSSPADVAATIQAPDTVSISLPPVMPPAPTPAPPTVTEPSDPECRRIPPCPASCLASPPLHF